MTRFNLLTTLNRRERLSFAFLKWKMFGWFYFSHHPLCKNYGQEVFSINGMYICKGCTEVYAFTFITIVVVFILNLFHFLSVPILIVIALLSLAPSVIGNFYHFKVRIIKDFIRISLGIGIGIGLAQVIILPELIDKVLAVLVILLAYFTFRFTRTLPNNKQTIILCSNCEQFNDQSCENYKKVFKAEGDYSRIISDYIQKKLTENHNLQFGFIHEPNDD